MNGSRACIVSMSWRYFAVAVLAASFAFSCVSITGGGEELDPERYKTPVAQAVEAGLRPYWLGPAFELGGLSFNSVEAEFPEGAAGQRIDGVEIRYAAIVDYARKGSLDLSTFRKSDWAMAEGALRSPQGIAGDSNDARIQGREAEIITLSTATRPLNRIYVIMDLGDQVLLVQTASRSTGGRGGIPDVNPLLDQATLLSVLENLRPYPE
jgi:hypothetical protein